MYLNFTDLQATAIAKPTPTPLGSLPRKPANHIGRPTTNENESHIDAGMLKPVPPASVADP